MAILTCPNCGLIHRGAAVPACLKCKAVLVPGAEPAAVKQGLTEWPAWAKVVAKQRRDGEAGVGDTFDRLASKVGGKAFKAAMKKMGIPCGCDGRKRDWNALYPYR